jgi:hypothetical protein
MGAWGIDAFANDGAMDWFAVLEAEGLIVTGAAVQAILDLAPDYLEAPVCEEGLAAAEIIAGVRGRPSQDLPPDVAAYVRKQAGFDLGDELIENTRRAVALVLESSELAELWAESDEADAWRASVIDLQTRLQ